MIKFLWNENASMLQTFFKNTLLLFLILITVLIVYISGGTSYAYTHLMYLPIMLGASFYRIKGGLATGLIAGLTLGPHMPLNVAQAIAQTNSSWIIRLLLFSIIGTALGWLFLSLKKYKENEIQKLYKHIQTGYPNSNKLKIDLHKLVELKNPFTIIIFEIQNLDQINLYTNYETGEKAILLVLDVLKEYYGETNIYTIYNNIISVTLPFYTIKKAISRVEFPLQQFDKPHFINGLPVSISIKCGIINYPLHSEHADDLYIKMERTLKQDSLTKEQISVYDNTQVEKNKKNYDTMISLNNAINNSYFSLVYQPKVSAKTNEIIGFEALLRWNRGNNNNLTTGEFIKLAESTGFISEITKWTIKNVLIDMKSLQNIGIYINVAINISYLDLKNDYIFNYTKKLLKKYEIPSNYLEFELTERSIFDSSALFDINTLLNKIRAHGIKISIDDFGTGYNTLIHLMNLPIDYVKIDKMFIDNCDTAFNHTMIETIIKSAHSIDMQVIAEGVETKEQLEILRELNCDYIQGYYYSKPMPFDKIKDYIANF